MKRILSAVLLGVMFSAGAVIGPMVDRSTRVSAQGGTNPVATTTFPNRRYNQGVDTFGPVAVPVGASQLTLKATRDAWPQIGSEIIQVIAQMSFDGGNTWIDWGGFGAYGGDAIQRDGSIAPESTFNIALPDSQNPQRQLRGRVTVNRALNTAITVTVQ